MPSRLFTIVLLAVASLRVNAASLTGVIITNEATSTLKDPQIVERYRHVTLSRVGLRCRECDFRFRRPRRPTRWLDEACPWR
jgi:hypothetical protein